MVRRSVAILCLIVLFALPAVAAVRESARGPNVDPPTIRIIKDDHGRHIVVRAFGYEITVPKP